MAVHIASIIFGRCCCVDWTSIFDEGEITQSNITSRNVITLPLRTRTRARSSASQLHHHRTYWAQTTSDANQTYNAAAEGVVNIKVPRY